MSYIVEGQIGGGKKQAGQVLPVKTGEKKS